MFEHRERKDYVCPVFWFGVCEIHQQTAELPSARGQVATWRSCRKGILKLKKINLRTFGKVKIETYLSSVAADIQDPHRFV